MNTKTGEIFEKLPNESVDDFTKRVNAQVNDLIELANMPNKKCPKCRGLGYKKRGLFSKRFKPCECVMIRL